MADAGCGMRIIAKNWLQNYRSAYRKTGCGSQVDRVVVAASRAHIFVAGADATRRLPACARHLNGRADGRRDDARRREATRRDENFSSVAHSRVEPAVGHKHRRNECAAVRVRKSELELSFTSRYLQPSILVIYLRVE